MKIEKAPVAQQQEFPQCEVLELHTYSRPNNFGYISAEDILKDLILSLEHYVAQTRKSIDIVSLNGLKNGISPAFAMSSFLFPSVNEISMILSK
jgi:hypothetical protein